MCETIKSILSLMDHHLFPKLVLFFSNCFSTSVTCTLLLFTSKRWIKIEGFFCINIITCDNTPIFRDLY